MRGVCLKHGTDVRFGSKADIEACLSDVRFTPESGIRQRSDFMNFQTSIISFVLATCRNCHSACLQARRPRLVSRAEDARAGCKRCGSNPTTARRAMLAARKRHFIRAVVDLRRRECRLKRTSSS